VKNSSAHLPSEGK